MIPKIIHYCWISGDENMPEDIKKCMATWHKYLPDYEFINWNDSNFDWNINAFTKYCRENNLYAFCADYVRYWALYHYGGFYLDSDVRVFKSFDELLNLKRVITTETAFKELHNLEAAIMGCKKGDEIMKDLVDWYDKCDEKWDYKAGSHVLAPAVMKDCWEGKYILKDVSCIENIQEEDGVINILDADKYFDSDSNSCFAQHQFRGSWCGTNTYDCYNIDNYTVFLCAHKPIENYIPMSNKYVLLDVTGNVKDSNHTVIDISEDSFVKTHNVCYSEGCAIRWLWKHPDIIPDYICFGHYRRMFFDFVNGKEKFITRVVDNHGAIIQKPFDHSLNERKTNKGGMFLDHPMDDAEAFIQAVREAAPEYWGTFQELLNDHFQYACNCFAMKKEHFLEMCEMCFRVLDHFDKKQGYTCNEDVFSKMVRLNHRSHLRFGINWQARLQGFWMEWLTELYYRQKFGVENCHKSKAGIPINPRENHEKDIDNWKWLNRKYVSLQTP